MFNRDLVGQLTSDVVDTGDDEALPNPGAQRETAFGDFQVKGYHNKSSMLLNDRQTDQYQEERKRDPVHAAHKLESHSQDLRQTRNQDQEPVGIGE